MKKTDKTTGILQRIMRRTGTAFIILAGLLLLTTCGEKKQESGSEAYLYVPEQIQADIMSGGYTLNKCNFHVTEDYLYFLDGSLYRIPIENGPDFNAREEVASYKDLFQNLDEQSSYEGTTSWNDVLCFTVDEQENLYYCVSTYGEMRVILNKRSADGEHIYQIPMEPEESMSGHLNDPILAVDNEGNAYIVANNTIRRYDPEGNLTGQIAGTD